MGCSEVSTLVFIDTNLDTHFCVPVSPKITAMEFKRELERLHVKRFPEFANVGVRGMMVKRKSCYYHLAESLPIKCAFQGLNGTWFLQIEMHTQIVASQMNSFECHGNQACHSDSVAEHISSVKPNCFSMDSVKNKIKCKRKRNKRRSLLYIKFPALRICALFSSLKKTRKRKRKKRNHEVECQGRVLGQWQRGTYATGTREVDWEQSQMGVELPREKLPESVSITVSVSGIIKKYFTDYDEVDSSTCYPSPSVKNTPNERPRIADSTFISVLPDWKSPLEGHKSPQFVQSEKPSSETIRNRHKKPEVGKRLLLAACSLRFTPGRQQAALSLCKSNSEKSPAYKSMATARSLVFEIPDEDD